MLSPEGVGSGMRQSNADEHLGDVQYCTATSMVCERRNYPFTSQTETVPL
jgi:hypothetical protein